MARRFRLLALFALVTALPLSLAGCTAEDSSTVDQGRIYGDYWLYYDETSDVTTVRAAFRLGGALGTLLRLGGGAQVSFEGMPLTWNDFLGTHERKIPGFVNGGTFRYTDTRGQTFVNTIASVTKIDLPASIPPLPRTGAISVAWAGTPLVDGESVVINIRTERLTDIQLGTVRGAGATDVLLARDQLQRIPAGPATMGLQRFQDHTVQQATSAGAHLWSTYASPGRAVTVQ